MNYFRHDIEAYDRFTRDLSMVEDAAYHRLLRHYYHHEKPLPLDPEKLTRIARALTEDERQAVRTVLASYFTKAPDGWHNARADDEIRVYQVAIANGAKGGRPASPPPVDKPVEKTGSETGSETGPRTRPRTGPRTKQQTESGTRSTTEQQTGAGTGTVTGSGQPLSLSAVKPLNQHQPKPKTGGSSEAENSDARATADSAPPSGSGATARAPHADTEELDDSPVPQAGYDIPWWHTPAGFQRQAPEVKVSPRDEEEFEDFAARVCVASGPGPWLAEVSPAIRARIPQHLAPGAGA